MQIVVSLTTIPDREEALLRCLKSILDQGRIALTKIVVNIPVRYRRIQKNYPEQAKKRIRALSSKIRIKTHPVDLGPGLKYLGHQAGKFTFVCDDDQIYPQFHIFRLSKRWKSQQSIFCARRPLVGYAGILFPPGALRGYGGFLRRLPSEFYNIDDNTMEVFLYLRGRRVSFPKRPMFQIHRATADKEVPAHALITEGDRYSLQIKFANYVLKNYQVFAMPPVPLSTVTRRIRKHVKRKRRRR